MSETYHPEKEKRRLKRSKGKPRLFTSADFHLDTNKQQCRCPAGMTCGVVAKKLTVQDVFTPVSSVI
ncbi:hypothetical protein [Colwellia psychrerythraea]|uniref:hypothetical protein n=1 Tax=Colwellia psychrerythraea TaxID=28229 RepID=UPI0012E09105|nr:hypothetical protein [Colwellia psychrerythraea]